MVKPGNLIVVDGKPHKVKQIEQGKRGKGGAYVRALLLNMITNQSFEKTFLVDEHVQDADIEQDKYTYSWGDGESFNFLHGTTFEECVLGKSDLADHEFLVEGMEVRVQKFQGKVVGVILPQQYNYTVVKFKSEGLGKIESVAILNNGAEVRVPAFVKQGEDIRVDISLRKYVQKV
eukprot:gene580-620_t